MPFKSKAQRRFMYAAEERGDVPKGTASRWEEETPEKKSLPERIHKQLAKREKKADAASMSSLLKEMGEIKELLRRRALDMQKPAAPSANAPLNAAGPIFPLIPRALPAQVAATTQFYKQLGALNDPRLNDEMRRELFSKLKDNFDYEGRSQYVGIPSNNTMSWLLRRLGLGPSYTISKEFQGDE